MFVRLALTSCVAIPSEYWIAGNVVCVSRPSTSDAKLTLYHSRVERPFGPSVSVLHPSLSVITTVVGAGACPDDPREWMRRIARISDRRTLRDIHKNIFHLYFIIIYFSAVHIYTHAVYCCCVLRMRFWTVLFGFALERDMLVLSRRCVV